MIFRRALRPLLRFAFRLFYNPFAFTYDLVSELVSRGHWREWTRAAIPHVVGTRVLEVPCGTGNLLLDLFAAGYHPIGVDLSPSMLRISSRKVRARRKTGARHLLDESPMERKNTYQANVLDGQYLGNASHLMPHLIRASVQVLPFPPATYDSIVMTFPPSFVFDQHALAELRRVLDDRGRLIWVDAGRLLPRDFWSRALNWALDATSGEGRFDDIAGEVLSRAGYDSRVETVRDEWSIAKVVIATKKEAG